METMELVRKHEEEMVALRRHIHQNPEISNAEFETTKLIKEKLTEYGVEIVDIGLKTGVVGVLRGAHPGKTVAIREDIDALPMPELTGLPFASVKENICHSCGHDMHTAILLACAKALVEIKDELSGNVMFLFQPAEENGTGAKQIVDCDFTRVLKPDVFIGLHTAPGLTAGTIGVKKGPAGASADTFKITVTGKGGHGAHPENCIDPIAAACYLVTQLQTVISRENHPVHPGVMTIGSFHAGKAPNVIPDSVELLGTLRSLDAGSREGMQRAIDRITESCCAAMRTTGTVEWNYGMPPLVNSDEVVDAIEAAAEKTIGLDHVEHIPEPSLGSEDFSYLFPAFGPGAQFSMGTGNDSDPNTRHGIHNSKNVFDESGMRAGAAVLLQFTRDFLK